MHFDLDRIGEHVAAIACRAKFFRLLHIEKSSREFSKFVFLTTIRISTDMRFANK